MPALTLLIHDIHLRDALLEQLTQIADMTVQSANNWDAVAGTNHPLLVVDDEAVRAIPQAQWAQLGKTILILGHVDGAIPDGVEILPKPFRLGVLLDKILYYSRVAPRLRGQGVVLNGYKLDSQSRQITVMASGEVIRLTEKETALLDYLANQNAPVARDDLLAAVWGYDDRVETHTLETHIYQLRRKLNPAGARDEVLMNDGNGYYLIKGNVE